MYFANQWQLLLWIVALLIAAAPIVVFAYNWAVTGYFRAKTNYIIRMFKMYSEAFEKAMKEFQARKKDGSK